MSETDARNTDTKDTHVKNTVATGDAAKEKRFARMGALLMGLGALTLWLASRVTWMTVHYDDDRTGNGAVEVNGATWSTEVTAVVLLLLAAAVAGLALRRWGRRLVGGVGAVAALAVTVPPLGLLTGSPDPERAKALLTLGGEETTIGSTVGETAIPEWAAISNIDVAALGPAAAVIASLVAAAGGLILAVRPGRDAVTVNKYEKASQRREKIEHDLEAEPDSGRVLWDAIDADMDPTDTSSGTTPTNRE
ncbi:TIGR02234 family membrane protein [Corynebacterium appendicis]|uniref:TIGR02234 family membrane protein n=1 Tax=Corynebacterium appendicis TaxID=163202 RepID=UPI00223B2B6A|nr:TIGR02234 family membrane protein [Corynebacterium appendicis]MCT1683525.1 TIGR02234 family membrane protein [Corynebacterium appendicis]